MYEETIVVINNGAALKEIAFLRILAFFSSSSDSFSSLSKSFCLERKKIDMSIEIKATLGTTKAEMPTVGVRIEIAHKAPKVIALEEAVTIKTLKALEGLNLKARYNAPPNKPIELAKATNP